jgi:molecular chaperone DnaK
MAGRLGIDFGTSNTVLAIWDAAKSEGVPFHLPQYGREIAYRRASGELETISVIPSLIHYSDENQRWIGEQVRSRNWVHSDRTFRWMKRYIAHRSKRAIKIGNAKLTNFDAGKDFLTSVLGFVAAEINLDDDEVGFTVPVDSYEHYEDWLSEVATAASMPRIRLIDEPSAAALGYGAHIQPGQTYLVFDFGGGTLDVVVVLIEESDTAVLGRRCRVLGKSGTDIGGAVLDSYLFRETLKRNDLTDTDDSVRKLSRALLVECERAKERLSSHESADITVVDPDTGSVIGADFSRDEFEEILDEHEVLSKIDRTIREAFRTAQEAGYTADDVNKVLMVGGSSLIPCVRKTLRRIFGKDRVLLDRPLDAVARGASAFVAGVDFFDHIQHAYSIRYVDRESGDYAFREIVARGTSYPTDEAIAKITIKATHDGQTHLGIAIFEIGEHRATSAGQPVELIFDPSGAARLSAVTAEELDRRSTFWVNENSPTFLESYPPTAQGEPAFEVEFGIDENKRLLVSAKHILTGKKMLTNYPVVKLT